MVTRISFSLRDGVALVSIDDYDKSLHFLGQEIIGPGKGCIKHVNVGQHRSILRARLARTLRRVTLRPSDRETHVLHYDSEDAPHGLMLLYNEQGLVTSVTLAPPVANGRAEEAADTPPPPKTQPPPTMVPRVPPLITGKEPVPTLGVHSRFATRTEPQTLRPTVPPPVATRPLPPVAVPKPWTPPPSQPPKPVVVGPPMTIELVLDPKRVLLAKTSKSQHGVCHFLHVNRAAKDPIPYSQDGRPLFLAKLEKSEGPLLYWLLKPAENITVVIDDGKAALVLVVLNQSDRVKEIGPADLSRWPT